MKLQLKNIAILFAAALLSFSCKDTANEAKVMDDRQAVIDSMNIEMAKQKAEIAKQKSIDSMQVIVAAEQTRKNRVRNNAVAATPAPTAEQKKKGWSGAAKGAVIGAGVGAVSGALIDKEKHGRGAVIGGLAGAGLGAGTGAIIDDSKKKK